MKRTSLATLFLLVTLWLVPAPQHAHAEGVLQSYCKYEGATKKTQKRIIRLVSALTALKGTINMVVTARLLLVKVNHDLENVSKATEKVKIIAEIILPTTRSFFKAFLPTIQGLEKVTESRFSAAKAKPWERFLAKTKLFTGTMLDVVDNGLAADNNLLSDPVIKVGRFLIKFMDKFKWVMGAGLAYAGLNYGLCQVARAVSPHCKASSQSNKCHAQDTSYDDLDEDNPRCGNAQLDKLSAQYIARMEKFRPILAKGNAIIAKLDKIMDKIEAPFTKAESIMKPLNPLINGAEKALNGLNKAMIPVRFVTKEFEALLEKKICVTLKMKIGNTTKRTKKCSRLKNMVKDIKKLSKPFEAAMKKATEKIIDPLIKKLTNKLPTPGLSQLKKAVEKMSESLEFVTDLKNTLEELSSIIPTDVLNETKQLIDDLKKIEAQMAAANR
ncbi:MAG: hypothetical protein H6728_02060 [Myxococcales bacterium]|nr:hypothetical protein [Myxococcales bacterium]MCB9641837.1 hypothetical protein [Myxococcales bacterium]